jgi:hypothetical protein
MVRKHPAWAARLVFLLMSTLEKGGIVFVHFD